jgi:hypothetical protein
MNTGRTSNEPKAMQSNMACIKRGYRDMYLHNSYRSLWTILFIVLITQISCTGSSWRASTVNIPVEDSLIEESSQSDGLLISYGERDAFPLVSNRHLSILTDPADAEVVFIAADMLAGDISKVGGRQAARIEQPEEASEFVVIIGTIQKSGIIRQLIESDRLDVSGIQDKWETSVISVIDRPFDDVKQALVIAGSDRRGTAYGVTELSKQIGVSPWDWWADVTPKESGPKYVRKGTRQVGPPSVKYRGIFINDEEWGLQPWASKTFEPGKKVGPRTYEKVFELMLRMKANYIWPAMYRGTTPFYLYPENKKVADRYAIVMGTTHIEPLGRNNFYGGDGGEWEMWLDENNIMGETERLWDWQQNPQNMLNYWEERLIEMKQYENLYTVGLRGLRDGPMSVDGGIPEQVEVLEDVIEAQRELLSRWIGKPMHDIPQTFTPYKEVLEIYDEGGLQLPDDITIIWPNDSHGYIRRLSLPEENLRKGGTGIYYHFSYLGRPHGYYWLATTHPALVRNEMYKGWIRGSDKIWLVNVGDIKPREYLTELFLDMAWEVERFSDPSSVKEHLFNWIEKNLDETHASVIKEILWEYYMLAFERRPEFMGWNMTWPDIPVQRSEYNHTYYNDQIDLRIARYKELLERTELVWNEIPENRKDAFYQLVYYPVAGAAYINKKFLYQDKAIYFQEQNRTSANTYAEKSMAAYDSIARHTYYYNNLMSNGKWKHMRSMHPRDLRVFQKPEVTTTEVPDVKDWGIAPEYRLPVFPLYADKQFFIDLYQKGLRDISWEITPSDDWIVVSKKKGILQYYGDRETRIWVSIDKNKVPDAENLNGHVTISGGGKVFEVKIEAFQPDLSELQDFSGFIEINGYVSGFAENYAVRKQGAKINWEDVPGLGHTGNAVLAGPFSAEAPVEWEHISRDSGYLEYEIFTFSAGPGTLFVTALPAFPLNPDFSVRIAVSINGDPPVIRDFKAELAGSGRGNDEWSRNVLSSTAVVEVPFELEHPGRQKIRIYTIDPGVVLDRLTLDLGGLQLVMVYCRKPG